MAYNAIFQPDVFYVYMTKIKYNFCLVIAVDTECVMKSYCVPCMIWKLRDFVTSVSVSIGQYLFIYVCVCDAQYYQHLEDYPYASMSLFSTDKDWSQISTEHCSSPLALHQTYVAHALYIPFLYESEILYLLNAASVT